MIAPLTADPAWLAYEIQLRHLALIAAIKEAQAGAEAALVPFVEALRGVSKAFASLSRSEAYKRLLDASQGRS